MKRLLVLTLLSASIIACSPKQMAKDAILKTAQSSFDQMISAMNSGDYSKALDFSFPKLFDLVPREQIESMIGQFASMGIQNLTESAKISDISNPVKGEDYTYYKSQLSAVNRIVPEDKSLLDALAMQMETTYDKDQITKTEDDLSVNIKEDLYIMQDNESKQMYFLRADPQVQPMLGQILPEDVMAKFAEQE